MKKVSDLLKDARVEKKLTLDEVEREKKILNTKILLVVGTIFLVALYIFFQYSSLIFPPKLKITEPQNGQKISGNVIEVRGKTDPYATVFIGEDEAYVNIAGNFKKSVYM